MTNFKKQVFSVLAAGSLLVSVATPALAETTIQISGNGAGSNNAATVTQTNTTTVSQSNTANVTNNVTSNASTGGNDANYNTGGNVTVQTGAATSNTTVANNLNSNAAQVTGCNCGSDTNVKIDGNGALSLNQVKLTDVNATTLGQNNVANVTNNVSSDAKTGGNDANLNTGGTTTVVTGAASATSNVKTTANANVANVGGSALAGTGHSASFVIDGNGAGSNNWITAGLVNTNYVSQGNTANITNDVNSDAKTGGNDAKFNTGGDVVIATGMAMAKAMVDNAVNFNSANLDCGCVTDVTAKIVGNGANPLLGGIELPGFVDPNGIVLTLANANTLGQGNVSNLGNNVDADAFTGWNDANLNTGSVTMANDPAIVTGPATNVTGVSNSGNVNVAGSTPVVLPLPGGNTLGFSFSIQALMAYFGMSI